MKPNILLIAEKEELGSVISSFLKEAGFEITNISFLKQDKYEDYFVRPFDLVISTNNGQVPNDIQKQVFYIKNVRPDMKIILLTGYREPDFIDRMIKLGVDGVMYLPIKLQLLLKKIQDLYN